MDENILHSPKPLKGQMAEQQPTPPAAKGTIKLSKLKLAQAGKGIGASVASVHSQSSQEVDKPNHLAKIQSAAKKAAKKAAGLSTSKKAKTKPGATKAKLIAHIKQKKWDKWEGPDLEMICRIMAGGDLAAGIFLHCIVKVWRLRKKKVEWEGRDWLYMPRAAWANNAGLTENELKDRAIPRVKNLCFEFVKIRSRGVGANKRLWISLDTVEFQHAMLGLPFDCAINLLNGKGIGGGVPKANAYAKGI